MKKCWKYILTTAFLSSLFLSSSITIAASGRWQSETFGWRYIRDNGTYIANEWFWDGTHWYHFDQCGYMQTGWIKEGAAWFYLNPISDGTKGSMKTGWLQYNDNWYYLNPVSDGFRGTMFTGWHSINNVWYYFSENGNWEPSKGTSGPESTPPGAVTDNGTAINSSGRSQASYTYQGGTLKITSGGYIDSTIIGRNRVSELEVSSRISTGDLTIEGIRVSSTAYINCDRNNLITFQNCQLEDVEIEGECKVSFSGKTTVETISMNEDSTVNVSSSETEIQLIDINSASTVRQSAGKIHKIQVMSNDEIAIRAYPDELRIKNNADIAITENIHDVYVYSGATINLYSGVTVRNLYNSSPNTVTIKGRGKIRNIDDESTIEFY